MFNTTKELYGASLSAQDGEIGHVSDFYFDDQTWVIRYLVVDTGTWLLGRQVLLSPHSIGVFDRVSRVLPVSLNKLQIENAPRIDAHVPVSREHEMEYYEYYGWPSYWGGFGLWGLGGYPTPIGPTEVISDDQRRQKTYTHREDKHLQSAKSVVGYDIQAIDGELGRVNDFLVNDRSWSIRDIVVDAGHWYAGKEILIAPHRITGISYDDEKVLVDMTLLELRAVKEYNAEKENRFIV
jgi:uncharacterized protein YrrD